MSSTVDDAIANYVSDQNETRLRALDEALIDFSFLVPLRAPPTEISPGKFDIPTVTIRTQEGGVMPVFTSEDHFRAWSPEGGDYTLLRGDVVVRMAQELDTVVAIIINRSDAPRGLIPRSDFARLLTLAAKF